jgi:isoquinoline 1-oxidoreductase subunit beta
MRDEKTGAIGRRSFMVGAGGLTFGVAFGSGPDWNAAAQTASSAISPWVTLSRDGTITIMAAAAELGQGTRTAQPLVLAEEMDADWAKVRIVNAPPNDAVYGNPGVGGIMYTNAARTLSGYFPVMRNFGAQARRVLLDSVAKKWGVPVEELSTGPSVVIHARINRRIGYGDVVEFIELPAKAPEIKPEQLKKPADFRYLGRDVMRTDVPSKTRGAAQYGIDVQVPEMLYGVVLRSPVEGGGPANVDDRAARQVAGVSHVVTLLYGVGVVADKPWAALAARDALKVSWNNAGKAQGYDSEKAAAKYLATARDLSIPGPSGGEKAGDALAAIAGAAKVIDGEYFCDLAYHAQMEPLTAVASVAPDGQSAEIWLGTQSQTIAVESASKTLGIAADKIKLNDMMVGGAYGRRGHREHEFLSDALHLSKAAKKPVKMVWTREDDLRNGRFRPMTAHYLRAGLDASGKVVAWHHRVAADLTFPFQDPVRYARANGRDGMVAGGAEALSFDIPNRLVEVTTLDNGVRTSAMRGIGNGPNKYAIDAFMDEIARARNMDPIAFRLELVGKDPRAQNVIRTTARMADWGNNPPGRFKGFTFIDYSKTYMGAVAEVSVDRTSGEITVHRFWMAVDAGFVVQPDNIVAQMEGGVIYGLGQALTERITIEDGAVQQSNFHDYVVPRMRDVPDIYIEVISNPAAPPLGVGEQGVTTVAPAICNAVAAATGVRLRRIPMTPERVLQALKA